MKARILPTDTGFQILGVPRSRAPETPTSSQSFAVDRPRLPVVHATARPIHSPLKYFEAKRRHWRMIPFIESDPLIDPQAGRTHRASRRKVQNRTTRACLCSGLTVQSCSLLTSTQSCQGSGALGKRLGHVPALGSKILQGACVRLIVRKRPLRSAPQGLAREIRA